MLSRRELLRSAAVASVAMPYLARESFAQDAWPSREIHAICGFPPGTGADIFVRHYARKLQEAAGKTVIVENKAGAFGAICVGICRQVKAGRLHDLHRAGQFVSCRRAVACSRNCRSIRSTILNM